MGSSNQTRGNRAKEKLVEGERTDLLWLHSTWLSNSRQAESQRPEHFPSGRWKPTFFQLEIFHSLCEEFSHRASLHGREREENNSGCFSLGHIIVPVLWGLWSSPPRARTSFLMLVASELFLFFLFSFCTLLIFPSPITTLWRRILAK